MIKLTHVQAKQLCNQVLVKAGYSDIHAQAIEEVLMQAQLDDCHSHGLYRLLNCVTSLKKGKVSADLLPIVHDISASVLKVDAQNAMAPLAIQTAIPQLVEKANAQGIALLALNNCVHTTALWYEVELLVNAGLVGLVCTSNHAWVVPEGGCIPLFGTNPMAFGWPRPHGENPFIFDFSTTAMARGDIELHRKNGQTLPDGCGVDAQGQPTNDPGVILDAGAMKTFGAHKGSALAAMIELLAGPLIGDVLSIESQKIDAGAGGSPLGGEFILAISPEKLLGSQSQYYLNSAEQLFKGYEEQQIRMPSARRYKARAENLASGSININEIVYQDLLEYLRT